MSKNWDRLIEQATEAMQTGRYTDAIQPFKKALADAEKRVDLDNRVEALTGLGCAHAALRQFKEAEEVYLRAVSLATLHGFEDTTDAALASLAAIYREQRRTEEAWATAMRVIELTMQRGTSVPSQSLPALTILTKLCLDEKAFDQAVPFLKSSIKILNEYCDVNSFNCFEEIRGLLNKMPEALRAKCGTLNNLVPVQ